MKLTKTKLKQIIREEISKVIKEGDGTTDTPWILKALAKFPPDSTIRKHAEEELEELYSQLSMERFRDEGPGHQDGPMGFEE